MPKLFVFYLLSLMNKAGRENPLGQRTKSFEMKSTYLKVNKPNLKFVALKKMKIFRKKQRDTKDGVYRTQSLNQNWIK